jgi:hypothetical protein
MLQRKNPDKGAEFVDTTFCLKSRIAITRVGGGLTMQCSVQHSLTLTAHLWTKTTVSVGRYSSYLGIPDPISSSLLFTSFERGS